VTFCFDIDGVILTRVPGNDYLLSAPIPGTIALVNALFDCGHTIVLHTARGSLSGIDWTDVTVSQLQTAGVKYHQLLFGKPAADFYIDDRAMPLDALAELVRMGAIGTNGAGSPATEAKS
jgi:hypothetical protein